MKYRNAVMGMILSTAAYNAAALSLGAARGTVVLGQPIDLLFDLRYESSEDPGTACTHAEVYSGDAHVDASRVRVVSVPGAQGRVGAVRVQTTFAIDEPVAVVQLSVGCSNRVTRSYTLLPQLPDTVARSSAPVAIPFAPADAGAARLPADALAVPVPGGNRGAGRGIAPAQEARAAARPAPPRTASAPAPMAQRPGPAFAAAAPGGPPRAPAAAVQPAPPGRPRLALDSLEDWLALPSTLRLSPGLAAAPAEETSAQRTEAAALWKVLNASPQEVLHDAARVQVLDGEVRALRSGAVRDKAALADLQTRLAQAESDRFGSGIVYVLLGLLLLALGLVAWLVIRARRAAQAHRGWWEFGNQADTAASSQGQGAEAQTLASDAGEAIAVPAALRAPAAAPTIDVDLDHVEAAASAFGALPAAMRHSGRVVNPEDLFDVRQHADFFVSLGQYEEAINVLQQHIAENAASSPLAYLDLLHIFHTLSRVDHYGRLRARFAEYFNGVVPAFAEFNRPTHGLEDYPDVLRSIERAWGTPATAAVLEGLLVLGADGSRVAGPFALEAYRDLLLLYAIVLESGFAAAPGNAPTDAPSPPAGELGEPERYSRPREPMDSFTVDGGTIELEPLEPSLLLDDYPPEAPVPPPVPSTLPSVSGPLVPTRPGNLIDFDLDDEIEAGLARRPKPTEPR